MAYNSELKDEEGLWIVIAKPFLLSSMKIPHPVFGIVFNPSV